MKHFLHSLGSSYNFEINMREVDIERSESDDLLQEQLWEDLWSGIKNKEWDVVLLTPPCNTFSRARCNAQNSPGPVQIRNINHPWGFPWLTGSNEKLVRDHNFLLSQCFKTMHLCVRRKQIIFLNILRIWVKRHQVTFRPVFGSYLRCANLWSSSEQ